MYSSVHVSMCTQLYLLVPRYPDMPLYAWLYGVLTTAVRIVPTSRYRVSGVCAVPDYYSCIALDMN
jgi:hypothetical protein